MDSQTLVLTFRVVGARGQGAISVRGDDCLDLRMVFEGIPVDLAGSPLCP